MAKIVVLTSRFPYPLEKGDKLRIFYQVKSLGRKHGVHLVALNYEHPDKKQLSALSPYCKSISIFILPLYTRIWNLFRDREEIPHPDRNRIHVVQNGVDFEKFHPVTREKKYDLLFVGNMGYPPNIEAAYYAATEILPLVHKTRPRVNMLIAGINPPGKIRSLRSDTIRVIGYFEHIRDAFSQSRIMLAPMLISIGLQNKIIQAMAMKIPCIASPLANLAINAPDNTTIFVAGSAKEFAETIIFLLDYPEKGNEIAENAWLFVKQNFDWNSQNGELEKILLSKVK